VPAAAVVKTASVKTPKGPKPPKAPKPAKAVYSGPTEVIKLPPTPLLDEEGKQMLDPDGNPMFNAPVVQKRDKQGHPVFDASGKPVFQTATDKGFDAKGKKIAVVKVKASKSVPVVISRGTFTVDGMIGKAELNYTIPNFKFLYFYVPGVGVAVVSNAPFQGATVQKNAFKGNTLTVTVEDHVLQLGSDKPIVGKRAQGDPAFVHVDRGFTLPSKFPVVGYGQLDRAPYNWPGSKRNAQLAGIITPPPTPKNLLPVQLLSSCPPGQMRKPARTTLPGEMAPEQPCVLITKALQREEAADEAKGAVAAPAAEAAPASATDAATPAAPPAADTPATAPATPPATDTAPVPPADAPPPPAAAPADSAVPPASTPSDVVPVPATPPPASTPPPM